MSSFRNIDPTKNRWRFYSLEIDRPLFGDWSLTREYGRIGSSGRISVESFASEEEARRAERQTIRLRIRHGYSPAEA
jgi:predicted DNA-binding WGR domain protein